MHSSSLFSSLSAAEAAGVTRALKPSAQIQYSRYYLPDTQSFCFKLQGRPPTLIGGSQGDHVTAYALVARGIERHVKNIAAIPTDDDVIDRQKKLLDETRRDVRDRDVIDGYIARILAIDIGMRKIVVANIGEAQKNYNQQRFHKNHLQKITEYIQAAVQQPSSLPESPLMSLPLEAIKHTLKAAYATNARLVGDEICEIARLFLTAYNKTPNVTFNRVPECRPDDNEGAMIVKALNILEGKRATIIQQEKAEISSLKEEVEKLRRDCGEEDRQKLQENVAQLKPLMKEFFKKHGKGETFEVSRYNTSRRTLQSESNGFTKALEDLDKVLRSKDDEIAQYTNLHPETVARCVKDLFFYPRIPDQLLPNGDDDQALISRTNQLDVFYKVMANHLHITFAVYPEFEQRRPQIIEEFVKLTISNGWERDIQRARQQNLWLK